jgi:transposase
MCYSVAEISHAGKAVHRAEYLNPLSPELNPICYLLTLLAHDFLHVSRIRVEALTLRLLMSYIYIYIWSTYS